MAAATTLLLMAMRRSEKLSNGKLRTDDGSALLNRIIRCGALKHSSGCVSARSVEAGSFVEVERERALPENKYFIAMKLVALEAN